MRPQVRKIFIGSFLVLTLLPGLQTASRWIPDPPIDEQRRLAAAPSLDTPARALADANAWYTDHHGFRSLLIRLKATVDYRLFGYSDKVHVGEDGYLFYRSTLDVEKPRVEAYLAEHRADVLAGVSRYAQALARHGIGMVMVVNLLGDRFLPDKLPASVAARPPMRRIDSLVDGLRQVPNLRFVDSSAILLETAKTRPIFHRTDFHWNDAAAYPVAKEVVDHMGRAEGLPQGPWKHALAMETQKYSGGIARFMPLMRPPSERSLFTVQNWNWPQGFTAQIGPAPHDDVTHTPAGTPGLLHPVLFVGDSFMDAWMRNGTPAYFSSSYRLRWKAGLQLTDISAALPADARWLAVQFIEVQMPALLAFADPANVTEAIALLDRRRAQP